MVVSTLWVSALAPVSPVDALLAYDDLVHHAGPSPSGSGWSVDLTTGSLDVEDVAVRSAPDRRRYWPLRRARGVATLHRRRFSVAVELEVLPWSDAACEIGLRPTDERRARRWLSSPDASWQVYDLLAKVATLTIATELFAWTCVRDEAARSSLSAGRPGQSLAPVRRLA